MEAPSARVEPLDLRAAGDRDYAALSALVNRIRAERLPDDPPIPLDEHIQEWQNIPPFVDMFNWVIWNDERSAIVASAWGSVLRMEENQHVGQMSIEVLPESRRQGLGRRLLAHIADMLRRENRRMVIAITDDRISAGAAFMQQLGASKGIESHINQLDLADLSRDIIHQWQARASDRASRFELGFWDGAYPEDQIEAVAALYELGNQEPRDNLDIEDFHFTPAHLRQMEQSMSASGTQRWTLYVRERGTGAFAGFTDVQWHPNRPAILQQGFTGVFPQFRNKGLGRWLKAAMLERVLRERPQVKVVRTGNADSNAAMLRINHELGFKPYISQCVWQAATDRITSYLAGSR
jgi:GNAT superfamily N-acetyltransferase